LEQEAVRSILGEDIPANGTGQTEERPGDPRTHPHDEPFSRAELKKPDTEFIFLK